MPQKEKKSKIPIVFCSLVEEKDNGDFLMLSKGCGQVAHPDKSPLPALFRIHFPHTNAHTLTKTSEKSSSPLPYKHFFTFFLVFRKDLPYFFGYGAEGRRFFAASKGLRAAAHLDKLPLPALFYIQVHRHSEG